eukprot:jgi/Mesen1/7799/ME000408S06906
MGTQATGGLSQWLLAMREEQMEPLGRNAAAEGGGQERPWETIKQPEPGASQDLKPYVDWFEYEDKGHPLSSAPEPKRRFIPSKWEAKAPKEKPKLYLLWGDDMRSSASKTANGLAAIPAPKPKLPGQQLLHRRPPSTLAALPLLARSPLPHLSPTPPFPPAAPLGRRPPNRPPRSACRDRSKSSEPCRERDPGTISQIQRQLASQAVTRMCLQARGRLVNNHAIFVLLVPLLRNLLAGSHDGSVRVWEVETSRCRHVWQFGSRVRHVAWNPAAHLPILAVCIKAYDLMYEEDRPSFIPKQCVPLPLLLPLLPLLLLPLLLRLFLLLPLLLLLLFLLLVLVLLLLLLAVAPSSCLVMGGREHGGAVCQRSDKKEKRGFESMRQIPAYAEFIKERFERCLDLYLCPRTRKKRINIDPESLIPKLPKPRDLQPFPTTMAMEYRGHAGPVCSLASDPSGQWIASGGPSSAKRVLQAPGVVDLRPPAKELLRKQKTGGGRELRASSLAGT